MIKLKSLLNFKKKPQIIKAQIIDLDDTVMCEIPRRKMSSVDWHHSFYIPDKYVNNEDERYRLKFIYSDGSAKTKYGTGYQIGYD